MKKNIKLHGIGNEGNFNFYIFDKKQEVAKLLSKIFYDIFKLTWDFYDEYTNKKINVEKYRDFHQNIMKVGSQSRGDVFYGNRKMFVAIHCSQKLRLKFNEELFKIANMQKPTRTKKNFVRRNS